MLYSEDVKITLDELIGKFDGGLTENLAAIAKHQRCDLFKAHSVAPEGQTVGANNKKSLSPRGAAYLLPRMLTQGGQSGVLPGV